MQLLGFVLSPRLKQHFSLATSSLGSAPLTLCFAFLSVISFFVESTSIVIRFQLFCFQCSISLTRSQNLRSALSRQVKKNLLFFSLETFVFPSEFKIQYMVKPGKVTSGTKIQSDLCFRGLVLGGRFQFHPQLGISLII